MKLHWPGVLYATIYFGKTSGFHGKLKFVCLGGISGKIGSVIFMKFGMEIV